MQTLLVRLKPYDPRRGCVLRRFTYRGIKFHEERGWYRVDKEVAEYLRGVRQVPGDKHAPLAFDVCTEAEAQALDAEHEAAATTRKKATEASVATPEASARKERDDAKAAAAALSAELASYKLRIAIERKLGISDETWSRRAVDAFFGDYAEGGELR